MNASVASGDVVGILAEASEAQHRVHAPHDGKRRLYRADHDGLGPFKPFLESLWAQQLDRLAMLAEEAERR